MRCGGRHLDAMKANHELWSPFQSPEVREIIENMNAPERNRANLLSAVSGLWCAFTLALPLTYAFTASSNPGRALAFGLMLAHAGAGPSWRRYFRRFLCSTAWAKERGMDPEKLRLYAWRR